jgi:hypothetical protein
VILTRLSWGVDTHKDVHVAAVLTSLGVLRESKKFPATAAGYQALLAWVCTFGVFRRAGVECTGVTLVNFGLFDLVGLQLSPRIETSAAGSSISGLKTNAIVW